MNVVVIGLGLIGGSFALSLKKKGIASRIVGVDRNEKHAEQAKILELVDDIGGFSSVREADLIVLAIPVDASAMLLGTILNDVKPSAVVIDLGSTKKEITQAVKEHSNRGRYVAVHPMAGTENSGPTAAFDSLFTGKKCIICNKEESDLDALAKAELILSKLGMNLLFMDAAEHDKHIAYVSHLSHISSFTLGLTVLDIEKNEKNIFDMASTGFASTVRLAKSSPQMWSPIFTQNSENLSRALGEYIKHLQLFKEVIDNGETEKAQDLMTRANDIRRILEGIELNKNN